MDNVGWVDALGKDIWYAGRQSRICAGGDPDASARNWRKYLLPFPHPEQLVRVFDDLRGSNGHDVGMSAPELWNLRDRSDVLENISAIWPTDANMTGAEKPERVELLGTSTNYFGMSGAHPQIGRLYNQNDERPGFIDSAVLSDGFWRRAFGGDPAVLGQSIRLDGDLYTIMAFRPSTTV